MRICARCKEAKDEEEFNFKFRERGIRQYHCKECSRLYVRKHYIANKKYYLAKAKRRNTKIRNEVREYVWRYLLIHPCVDCGESDPTVLEFDHLYDKQKEISLLLRNATLTKLIIEINKCEIRCANCHRRKTAKEFGWYKKFKPL